MKNTELGTSPTGLRAQNHVEAPNDDERASKCICVSSPRYVFYILYVNCTNFFTEYVRYCYLKYKIGLCCVMDSSM